ncbi:hypothetical protein PENTCL1PPCAC_28977, partial [Pristionchus entomophagus]
QMDATTRVFSRNFIGRQGAEVVPCHRCNAPMRIYARKYKTAGPEKEHLSYRCPRRGCQTYKSMREEVQDTQEQKEAVAKLLRKYDEEVLLDKIRANLEEE